MPGFPTSLIDSQAMVRRALESMHQAQCHGKRRRVLCSMVRPSIARPSSGLSPHNMLYKIPWLPKSIAIIDKRDSIGRCLQMEGTVVSETIMAVLRRCYPHHRDIKPFFEKSTTANSPSPRNKQASTRLLINWYKVNRHLATIPTHP